MGLARKGTAAYGGTRKVGRPRKIVTTSDEDAGETPNLQMTPNSLRRKSEKEEMVRAHIWPLKDAKDLQTEGANDYMKTRNTQRRKTPPDHTSDDASYRDISPSNGVPSDYMNTRNIKRRKIELANGSTPQGSASKGYSPGGKSGRCASSARSRPTPDSTPETGPPTRILDKTNRSGIEMSVDSCKEENTPVHTKIAESLASPSKGRPECRKHQSDGKPERLLMSPPSTNINEIKKSQTVYKLDENSYNEIGGLIDLTQSRGDSVSSYSDEVAGFCSNESSVMVNDPEQEEGAEYHDENLDTSTVAEPTADTIATDIETRKRDELAFNDMVTDSFVPSNPFPILRNEIGVLLHQHVEQLRRHESLHADYETRRNEALGSRDRLESDIENKKAACEELQQAVGHANGLIKRVEAWQKERPPGEIAFSDKLVSEVREHAEEKKRKLEKAWNSVNLVAKELESAHGRITDAEARLAQTEVDLGPWLSTRDAVTALILRCNPP